MSNQLWKALLVAPAVLGIATFATSAQASEPGANSSADLQGTQSLAQVQSYGNEGKEAQQLDQVTSVSQLSDVKPTDWAFQALQSLVERYGCIAGYPNKTFRGNTSLSRYEFAAGMNACLDKINDLIAAGTADLVKKEDLEALQKLQEEFAAELAALRGRVDSLEVRTTTLEKQQFSTTTKLFGEVIFAVSDGFGGSENPTAGFATKDRSQTTFGDRVRLNLITSFTGKDQLYTRLQATNVIPPLGPGRETRFSFEGPTTDNSVSVSRLNYRFPVSKYVTLTAIASGGFFNDYVDVVNPLASDAQGTFTRFGRYNPIYREGGGAGGAATIKLADIAKLEFAYLAGNGNDPATGKGLFNGDYGALGQLVFTPGPAKIAFTYVNSYNNTETATTGGGLFHGTGSRPSNLLAAGKYSANSYGIQANVKVVKGVEIGGWIGYTAARRLNGARGDANVWNWAATLGFPDLGKRGNLGGIIFGMEPRLTGSTATGVALAGGRQDANVGYHIEAFYRYKLTDNISITPGILWLTAPNHNKNNDDIIVGIIRTTFSF